MHKLLRAAAEVAAQWISDADGLIIAVGAGMGVDSGLPDFRGDTGFWNAYPALAKAGVRFQEIASPAAFRQNPRLAWGFYGHRLSLYRRTVPHSGFGLLKKWSMARPHGSWVYTSNVDGQFQKAGFETTRIHECHGSIHHLQCTQPCGESVWRADSFEPVVDGARCELQNALPVCPGCGSMARPNVLMFNDWDWIDVRQAMQEARQQQWLARVQKPVVIEIGAGKAIATVRYFSQRILSNHDGRLIRINLRDADIPAGGVAVALQAGASEALHAIDAAIGH